jgi:hypothetical protein
VIDYIKIRKVSIFELKDDILGLVLVGLFLGFIQKNPPDIKIPSCITELFTTLSDFFSLESYWVNILILVIIYLILRPLFLRRWPYFPDYKYKADFKKFSKEWDFQGNISLVNNGRGGIQVTNSPSGCLLKNPYWLNSRIWRDFEADIEIIFPKISSLLDEWGTNGPGIKLNNKSKQFRSVLAIIFRAQSFDDYFMLSVWKIGKDAVFRPHVRVSGDLDIPLGNPENSNVLKGAIKNNKATLKLIVKGDTLHAQIKGSEKSFDWTLPTHYKTNLNERTNNTNEISDYITRNIPFRTHAGRFGFRNYGDEIAIVKSLVFKRATSKENRKVR